MPFDAGMFSASVNEINTLAGESRVEKIYQPEKEEVVLLLRTQKENYRLSVRAGSNSPRFALTRISILFRFFLSIIVSTQINCLIFDVKR